MPLKPAFLRAKPNTTAKGTTPAREGTIALQPLKNSFSEFYM
jgi:hypothetical protein